MRLHKGTCYVDPNVATPANTQEDYDIIEKLAEIRAKEEG